MYKLRLKIQKEEDDNLNCNLLPFKFDLNWKLNLHYINDMNTLFLLKQYTEFDIIKIGIDTETKP